MREARHTGRWIAAAPGAVLLLAVLLLLYTPPGLALAGRMARPLSGGLVTVEGLGGFFPNRLHAEKLEVADSAGVWLRVERASLRWSALALIGNHVRVRDIAAARITVLRRPIPSGAPSGESPLLDIDRLSLPRIELAAPVIGHAVTLSASGGLHYASPHRMQADLLVTRAGNGDRYRIAGGIAQDVAQGSAEIREGPDGILGKLAGLPGLGPVNLAARAGGDARANTLSLDLSAGPLRAEGHGVIRLAAQSADLDLSLQAPAMTPRPGLAWRGLAGTAHFHGRFDAPALRAHLLVQDGTFAGTALRQLALDADGDMGAARLTAVADGVTLPGAYPGLFAHAPVRFEARTDLKAAARPVTFALTHPLASLHGTARTRGDTQLAADLAIPALAPFAALEEIDLRGSAGLHAAIAQAGPRMTVALNGTIDAQGTAMAARLLGRKATLDLNAVLQGADLGQSRVRLHGAAIATDVEGSLRKGVLNYRLALDMADLSRLAPMLRGSLALRGSVNGPLGDAALTASGAASLATRGFARQRVAIDLQASGLPAPRDARLMMNGRLDDAPLLLHAALRDGKTRQAGLAARWKSLDAKAELTIGENSALAGKVGITVRQLADLAAFTGAAVSGGADAAVTLKTRGGKTDATVAANAKDLRMGAMGGRTLSLQGTVGDLTGKPVLGLTAVAQGMTAQGFTGDAQAQLDGVPDRLGITLASTLTDSSGAPLQARGTALLNLGRKQVTWNSLDGAWRGTALKLQAPATVDFAGGLAVDRLLLRMGKGEIAAAGRVLPKLALKASASGIAVADFKPFLPQIGAQGTLSADADLSGAIAAPQGSVTLRGRDLRTAFSGRSVPPAAIDLRAQLNGDHAAIDAAVTAGTGVHLTLTGTAPLAPGGVMALHAGGNADLALLDPFLAAAGRRVRGTLTLDAAIDGTLAAPRIRGGGKLAGGDIRDYARGARIHDIAAMLEADGTRLRLTELTGRAGPGTITGSGSIDLAAPGMPIAVTLQAKDARPITSDLITASLSGALALEGHVKTAMTLSGKIQVTGGEINLPENFPAEVAVLNVRRRGQPPPPPPPPQGRIGLEVAVRTTGPVFVRGRGMDAEMGGAIHIGGSSAAPAVSGGLRMNHGAYSVAGQTLDFTTGQVRFAGTGVRGGLDPTLDFVAQTVSGGVTATLTITGYASAPKITLSSTPQLPQDEIVAHLLFQQSVKQLTPLQLASIAQGAAAMGGIGGGFNPLGTVRRTLGLDRLSVGSANGGAAGSQSQTTVEAGRYVARNVYVGVKQNLSGGTQTQVQVDITRRLKAQATVSAGTSGATVQGSTLQDNGSSAGLSYQFEY